jgi:hypothetical protein
MHTKAPRRFLPVALVVAAILVLPVIVIIVGFDLVPLMAITAGSRWAWIGVLAVLAVALVLGVAALARARDRRM